MCDKIPVQAANVVQFPNCVQVVLIVVFNRFNGSTAYPGLHVTATITPLVEMFNIGLTFDSGGVKGGHMTSVE